jgi:hypothetical protein
MPVEPVWSFYPKYAVEFIRKTAQEIRLLAGLALTVRRIKKDPNRLSYMDEALTPVSEDEEEKLALFVHSEAARHAVEHARKISGLTRAKSRGEAPVQVGSASDTA